MGQPTEAAVTYTTGNDPGSGGSGKTYHVIARDYTNAFVLYKPLSDDGTGTVNTNTGSDTDTTVTLPAGNFYPLNADGSRTGPISGTYAMTNGQGAILMKFPDPNAFTPNKVTGCITWLDFADSGVMYKDTGKTTHVATDGDLIACITDKATTPTADWVNSDSGGQPTYNSGGSGVNGLSVGTFGVDGDTTALISPQGLPQTSGEVFIVSELFDDPTTVQPGLLSSIGADLNSIYLGIDNGPLEVNVGSFGAMPYAVDGDTNL